MVCGLFTWEQLRGSVISHSGSGIFYINFRIDKSRSGISWNGLGSTVMVLVWNWLTRTGLVWDHLWCCGIVWNCLELSRIYFVNQRSAM